MNRPVTHLGHNTDRSELEPAIEYISHQLKHHLLRLFAKRNASARAFRRKWWQPPHWHFDARFDISEADKLRRYYDVGPYPHSPARCVAILGYSEAERLSLEKYYLETVRSGPCRELSEIKIVEATAYAIDGLPDEGCPPLLEMGRNETSYWSSCHPIYAKDGVSPVSLHIELRHWNPTKNHFFLSLCNHLSGFDKPHSTATKTAVQSSRDDDSKSLGTQFPSTVNIQQSAFEVAKNQSIVIATNKFWEIFPSLVGGLVILAVAIWIYWYISH